MSFWRCRPRPVTEGLGYEQAGITLDRGFVITNDRLHTGVGNIYAVGDIVPGLQLAHRGFMQGIFVAEEIAGLNPTMQADINIPRVTFCEPEIASVGMTEKQAREKFGDQVRTSSTTSPETESRLSWPHRASSSWSRLRAVRSWASTASARASANRLVRASSW